MNTDTGTFDEIPPEPKARFQRIEVGESIWIKGEECRVVRFGGSERDEAGNVRHREITLRLLAEHERSGNRHDRRAEAAQERKR